jgi:ureidoglycolate dehydrogenase (NAD+)
MNLHAIKNDRIENTTLWKAMPKVVEEFATVALIASGTQGEVARSVALALTETSVRGVDSHGIRLLLHYAKVVKTGRINREPRISIKQTGRGTAIVDADNGFGHHASFFAIDRILELAQETGIAAVAVINSSHFGAAGCYVLRAAEKGYVALGVCNSDSFVLLHNGLHPFHGTNPLAFAAPVPGSRPFLVDMATSVIPWNRVQDLMNEGLPLPADASVDSNGEPVLDPAQSAALLPLGGPHYGYKGAALAGIAEVLSAVLTGMPFCSRLLSMAGPDLSTHRRLGHFFIVLDPRCFISQQCYDDGIVAYLHDLREQASRPGTRVMAPGDREWSVEEERKRDGIPFRPQLKMDLDDLADRLGIDPLQYL